ncbi:MAG: alkaline phosphatase family protein [Cyclobacteriaceae bacterium]|nr:alkaline phosphatase family protein [Cyclobacteriaceae bacterium]
MKHLLLFSFFFNSILLLAQDRPKLVVGIVVDQMRQEYLYRYEKKFGPGGFRRLVNDGFMLKNAHYNYIPTYTGPGHASIYTGTTPALHGIIGNDWYDKDSQQMVNCVGDNRQKPVGVEQGRGAISPWRMLSTTITDELELSTQRRSKVVGISMKDRGAVLPAGHMPDGAYWFDGPSGKFISSTYYKPGLPMWLEKFNALKLPEQYISREWKPLLPIEQYEESGPDDSPYETRMKGKDQKPVFPYKLKEIRGQNTGYDVIIPSPFGNDLLTDLAKAALEGEEMGADGITDFLSVSYSSPDYVGHAMGPNSVEVEDIYLRLDKNLEDLLNVLDRKVGTGNYLVFLTSDHGVADIPSELLTNKIPAGVVTQAPVIAGLTDFLKPYFGDKKIIERVSNGQIFLNHEAFSGDLKSAGVDLLVATELIVQYLITVDGIADVYTASSIRAADFSSGGVKGSLVRGYNHKRSGDILVVLEPQWFEGGESASGTTHGSTYSYDTHIPIIFYGFGIAKGSSVDYQTITDIAPTLSVLMKIKFPSACTGQPVARALK